MIRRGFFIGLLSLMLGACATSSTQTSSHMPSQHSAEQFVSVDGKQLMLGGQPYYFVGSNFWYGAYLGATKDGRKRLVKELDDLNALGITNLRVLAGSEASQLLMSVSPAVIQAPGKYNETLLRGLDFLLDEMAKRNMKAVLFFSNFWQWSGGMAQYVAWDRNETPHDPDLQGDWNGFMQYSAQFYLSDRTKAWYNKFVEHLITRKNTINGKVYSDDAAIMSWELANEPRPGSDTGGQAQYSAFKQWIQDTAKLIKTLDTNHLVTTGSEGSMGTSRQMSWFIESHDTPYVDYLTFHLWPKNWSWYDAQNPELTFNESVVKTKAYILQHIEVAWQLNKPIVLEEFGLERDGGRYAASASTRYRDAFLKSIYNLIEHQVRIGAPIVGSNVWAWGGAGRAQQEDYIWKPGDPFTGDPPQEHQGLNSIFDSDASTLEIMSNHSKALEVLRGIVRPE